ncbi:hypothetical protein UlMin_040710 [Ulmus minor]
MLNINIFCREIENTIVRATYYNPPDTPSACHGFKMADLMVAAASKKLYGNRSICGKTYKVKCLGADYKLGRNPCKANKEVIVTMVDLCPGY